ncbi:MAG: helix-turn-helix domain-containing protein [Candidatus Aenigmarchaeota archaeon]|nr:helix-turn-helix domain-containing protein [Candidatus Aenigmarchaeota archaeon]
MEGNNIKENIIKLLSKHPNGLAILEIAKSLNLHRHTASRYVFALQEAGYIQCQEVGRAKICLLKEKRGLKR